jgi:hypothetical protein
MKRFLGICLGAFLPIYASSAVAKTGAGGLNPAEKWVVAQVTEGRTADLSEKFPDKEKEKRKLSAHSLEALLTGALPGVKPHRNGVRIIGPTIDESIDLTNAQIPCEVHLHHCQFMSSATFERVSFTDVLLFNGSAFKADASFSGMKVGGYAWFNDAVFEGQVSFVSADIAGGFIVGKAKFQNKEKEANFNSMKVGGYAFFNDVVFEGPVIFSYSDFAWLDLSSASRPKVAAQFYMQGMSYKYIRAVPGNEPESHKALLTLAEYGSTENRFASITATGCVRVFFSK